MREIEKWDNIVHVVSVDDEYKVSDESVVRGNCEDPSRCEDTPSEVG